MNSLENHLKSIGHTLYAKFVETKNEVTLLLEKYATNFPDYTDHSINHTTEVFQIASEILTEEEIASLGGDETYILSMACILHDIGMCISQEKISSLLNSSLLSDYMASHPNISAEDAIRDIHHVLSDKFINEEWELLKIPTKKYAKAIGIVAAGHRKVDLGNFEIYDPQFFAKSGKESVGLPFLGSILRIADELDVTNSRVPKLLTKYYMPNNDKSIREWEKHIATSQRNYRDNVVVFEVDCSDQNIYAALQDQFDKIQSVINSCQKVIRAIPTINGRKYSLNLSVVEVKYTFIGFDPKGIRFSFDVQNVVNAFVGEDLYNDKLTSLREAVQNAIDSCRYKSRVLKEDYKPSIEIDIYDESIKICDNGAGMDEFIIENFFGRLASSFYEQEKVKTQFEAIGQFGVGVFSYFLISEYIDIETKTLDGKTLKFRFDKDPKSYFHFYTETQRNSPGTTVTMYLKKEMVNALSVGNIIGYIRKIFRHIEIPISIRGAGNNEIIEFKGFEIDISTEIKNRLKLQHKKYHKDLIGVQVTINDDELEGNCALIIGKDYLKTFYYPNSLFERNQFDTVNYHDMSQISITQKGVFVNDYSSYNLNLLIGDINLKKKIKINIDRNEFANEKQVCEFIVRFETKLLEIIFSTLESKYNGDNEKITVTNDFLQNYYNYNRYRDMEDSNAMNNYLELFKKYLYVELYHNKKLHVIKIEELLGMYKEFILVSKQEDIRSVSNIGKAIVIAEGWRYEGIHNKFETIFSDVIGLNKYVIEEKKRSYQVFKTEGESDEDFAHDTSTLRFILRSRYLEICKSNSDRIFLNIWIGKEFDHVVDSDDAYLNFEHHFVQFVIRNRQQIMSNIEFLKIIDAAFKYMSELQDQKSISKTDLIELNEMLRPLNSIQKLKPIKLKDFYDHE